MRQRVPNPAPLDLGRSEVAHVADALDVLVRFHGGRWNAERQTGISKHLFDKVLQRKASEKVTRAALAKVAALFGVTVEQLLAGKGSRELREPA